ncbi:penicillin-binding protein 1A [Aminobacter aminovorans]|uniref:Penicillin-binding protein 1A n=1 Tax=Aminobacter aminovorans TaxID=83263 RepID=A0A380WIM4_AMIAI|nr:penicillin-binding protein 1A [Aminobacter aminovorans]TCS28916.1 penicillin-binding protein 1A [Aminobacter aminovorans]SUU88770.1 Penicillin-binding protein 1A [Aminobacter aminovorans]
MKFISHLFSLLVLTGLAAACGVALLVADITRGLPDYRELADWEPAVMTRVYAYDGALLAEYARERRLFLPIAAVPDRVRQAFLSAEDKGFYSHPGIDLSGLVNAVLANMANLGSGQRMIGGSTITQQIAKNLLLSSDRTLERKIREAVLSVRIERAFTKDEILELYFNDVYFGLGAYGIAEAALTYFDKPVGELSLAEAAYLAALPKGPNNYNPDLNAERAVARRNWVIGQMLRNGFVAPGEARAAMDLPLGTKKRPPNLLVADANYFTEAVRRQIAEQYGEAALYTAGLAVRTTLDPKLQAAAVRALRRGLVSYDQGRGYRGPVTRIAADGDWQQAIDSIVPLADVPEWRLAAVLGTTDEGFEIGLRHASGGRREREIARISAKSMRWALKRSGGAKAGKVQAGVLAAGDVVYVEKRDDGYVLRQVPEVQGALVSMDPHTGRVLASVGGFSFAQSEFNRATQAYRQPGSAFKPFVYAAALDIGYTPAALVMDQPIALPDGAGRIWKPKNYDGRFSGPSTLRTGLERSRNLMTVRLARHVGMEVVAQYGQSFGIYDNLKPYLPMSLGAGETTLMRLVSAYAVIANGGKSVQPSMIDRVQDRHGKTIFRHDGRNCDACNAEEWRNQPEPVLQDDREYVLDPMTAYQVTSMMRGVVERGTATSVSTLGVPVAGKTGTTNDEKDVWFIGYTPNVVTGVFLGYDTPKPMGYGESGGGLAAPVFIDFMKVALKGNPVAEFPVPEGMIFESVDRRTGKRVEAGSPGSIREAFKPGTSPCIADCPVIDGFEASDIVTSTIPAAGGISPALRDKLLNSTGGLY